jgi:hypothetical protein
MRLLFIRKFKRYLSLIFVFVLSVCFFYFISAHVFQSNVFVLFAPSPVSAESRLECHDPASDVYDSAECVRVRLGLQEIKTESFLIPRNPNDIITLVFIVLLAIVFIVSVFRVILISMKFSAAGDNVEKRQEALKQLGAPLIAVAVSFSALGITTFIVVDLLGGTVNNTLVDCDNLPANASQELKDKCNLYINNVIPT